MTVSFFYSRAKRFTNVSYIFQSLIATLLKSKKPCSVFCHCRCKAQFFQIFAYSILINNTGKIQYFFSIISASGQPRQHSQAQKSPIYRTISSRFLNGIGVNSTRSVIPSQIIRCRDMFLKYGHFIFDAILCILKQPQKAVVRQLKLKSSVFIIPESKRSELEIPACARNVAHR